MLDPDHFPTPIEFLLQAPLYLRIELDRETSHEKTTRLRVEAYKASASEALEKHMEARTAPTSQVASAGISRAAPPPGSRVRAAPKSPAEQAQERASNHLAELKRFRGPMDAYCADCKRDRPFKSEGNEASTAGPVSGSFFKTFSCQWNSDHSLAFLFQVLPDPHTVEKIGQVPSVKDLAEAGLGRYERHLDTDTIHAEMLADLRRGVGLAAHGIGAGAFVYLRRVFERLVSEAEAAATASGVVVTQNVRMEDRILAIKDFLPETLVENRVTYGVLSDTLHNLDLNEQACLLRFPAMRAGIEMILDGQIALNEKQKKDKATRETIAKLAGEMKGNSSSE